MSRFSPKPNIRQVVRSWTLPAGMSFAVEEDDRGQLWISESCPAGKQYWTAEQAVNLSEGLHTGPVLQEAILVAREREGLNRLPALPVYDAELEAAISAMPVSRESVRRRADSRTRDLAGV